MCIRDSLLSVRKYRDFANICHSFVNVLAYVSSKRMSLQDSAPNSNVCAHLVETGLCSLPHVSFVQRVLPHANSLLSEVSLPGTNTQIYKERNYERLYSHHMIWSQFIVPVTVTMIMIIYLYEWSVAFWAQVIQCYKYPKRSCCVLALALRVTWPAAGI